MGWVLSPWLLSKNIPFSCMSWRHFPKRGYFLCDNPNLCQVDTHKKTSQYSCVWFPWWPPIPFIQKCFLYRLLVFVSSFMGKPILNSQSTLGPWCAAHVDKNMSRMLGCIVAVGGSNREIRGISKPAFTQARVESSLPHLGPITKNSSTSKLSKLLIMSRVLWRQNPHSRSPPQWLSWCVPHSPWDSAKHN